MDSDPPEPPDPTEAAATGWEVELSVGGGGAEAVTCMGAGEEVEAVVEGGVSEGASPGAWG